MKLPKDTVDRIRAAWQRELAYADAMVAALRRTAEAAESCRRSLDVIKRANASYGRDFVPTPEAEQ